MRRLSIAVRLSSTLCRRTSNHFNITLSSTLFPHHQLWSERTSLRYPIGKLCIQASITDTSRFRTKARLQFDMIGTKQTISDPYRLSQETPGTTSITDVLSSHARMIRFLQTSPKWEPSQIHRSRSTLAPRYDDYTRPLSISEGT